MHIAVLISGRSHVSSMDRAVQNLSRLRADLSPANVVFFLSLNEAITDQQYLTTFCERMCIDISQCVAIVPHTAPDIINTFVRRPEVNIGNCWSMYRHNENAFNLMEHYEHRNAIIFDIVIKYRVDIVSHTKLNIPHVPTRHAIYIPSGGDYFGGINDQIALGDRASMKIYCNCSSNIIGLCKAGSIYHPETLLMRHLQAHAFRIVRFGYDYSLVR
jgi:hypothetical protein